LTDDAGLRVELGRRARELAESRFERDAVLGQMFGMFEAGILDLKSGAAV
jgi:hypothetical protein